jgi:hypothetical protein
MSSNLQLKKNRFVNNIFRNNYLDNIFNKSLKDQAYFLHILRIIQITTIYNILKNYMNLEHSRHRSPVNFLVHILACLTSYTVKKSNFNLDSLAKHNLLLS